jgi:hypothetical protein
MVEHAYAGFKRVAESANHLVGGGAMVWSLLGAIDANAIQVWTGVIVVAIAGFWGLLRDQRRRDFDDTERRKLLKLLVAANVEAINAKKDKLPFPEVVTLLVKGHEGTGVIEIESKGPEANAS